MPSEKSIPAAPFPAFLNRIWSALARIPLSPPKDHAAAAADTCKALPACRFVIGGGNTGNIFSNLDRHLNDESWKNHRGGKSWKEYLKGKKVICVTCATSEKEKAIKHYTQYYTKLGVEEHNIIFIHDRKQILDKEKKLLQHIQDPRTILFDFTGGDQDNLVKAVKGTAAGDALFYRQVADPHLTVFVTSASSAALSAPMMSEGEIRSGFGLLHSTIIDTHAKRGRLARSQKAVDRHPGTIAVLLDEQTALVLHKGVGMLAGDGLAWRIGEKTDKNPDGVTCHKPGEIIPGLLPYVHAIVKKKDYEEALKRYATQIAGISNGQLPSPVTPAVPKNAAQKTAPMNP